MFNLGSWIVGTDSLIYWKSSALLLFLLRHQYFYTEVVRGRRSCDLLSTFLVIIQEFIHWLWRNRIMKMLKRHCGLLRFPGLYLTPGLEQQGGASKVFISHHIHESGQTLVGTGTWLVGGGGDSEAGFRRRAPNISSWNKNSTRSRKASFSVMVTKFTVSWRNVCGNVSIALIWISTKHLAW